jgi:hypothetical protein
MTCARPATPYPPYRSSNRNGCEAGKNCLGVQDALDVSRERPAHRLDTPVARAEHGNVVDPGRENRKRHQCAAEPGQGDAADVLHRRELTEVARERPECQADADQRAHPDEQHDSEQRGVVHDETEADDPDGQDDDLLHDQERECRNGLADEHLERSCPASAQAVPRMPGPFAEDPAADQGQREQRKHHGHARHGLRRAVDRVASVAGCCNVERPQQDHEHDRHRQPADEGAWLAQHQDDVQAEEGVQPGQPVRHWAGPS